MLRRILFTAFLLGMAPLGFAQGFGYQGPGSTATGTSVTSGTSAPAAGSCDAADEVGDLYEQSGNPASVNLQFFRCTQTGAATFGWQPTGHFAAAACPATCTAATGPLCYDTDDDILYGCDSDDSWAAIAGGAGTVDTSGTPVDDDIAMFTDADTVEGRSFSEHATDMESAIETVLQAEFDAKAGECSGNGLMVRTAANTCTARSVTNSGGGLTLSNVDGVSGNIDITPDRAVVSYFSTGTGAAPATCAVGDWYFKTDSFDPYPCTATNTHVQGLTISNTATLTNKTFDANGTGNSLSNVDVSDLADGTDGELITWDASGNAAVIAAGTATHVLTSNGAGAAPTFQAVAGNANFDPGTTAELYEEFLGTLVATGDVGNQNLGMSAVATGTLAVAVSEPDHPGIYRINSHASNDDSGANIYTGTSSVGWANSLDNGDWELDAIVRMGANGTAITNAAMYFGVAVVTETQTADNSSHGMLIRYDSDRSDSTFIFQLCNAAGAAGCAAAGDDTSNSVVASTITPSAGNWYRLRISFAESGVGSNPTYYFRINDETGKTFCSSGCDDDLATEPTQGINSALLFGYYTRTTTGILSGDIDYLFAHVDGLSRY